MSISHLDIVTENIVIADFKAWDAGIIYFAFLHLQQIILSKFLVQILVVMEKLKLSLWQVALMIGGLIVATFLPSKSRWWNNYKYSI